ncbi:hypothetical protein ARMGADRAFT_1079536 [Armillaria gallica]|uniref:Uncharacterized protein n=1 Tax=Armillaria gallica TaxID=47427 RepID=A0A2H3E301_ARMGA|nr:hypothetical protein ARMGADRAFT_1079536 [Armillaria gallica]
MDRIEANFCYWKSKISKAQKVHDKKNDNKSTESDEGEVSDDEEGATEQALCKSRHYARKLRKCAECKEVREAAELNVSELDFFFVLAYQSTDESDQDNGLDPDTDTEKSAADCMLRLDTAVKKQRKHLEKETRGKAGLHPWRDGDPKDTMLPRFKCGRPEHMKIPRYAIDEDWLATHEEQDMLARISQPEEEGNTAGLEAVDATETNLELGGIKAEINSVEVERETVQHEME